MEIEFMVKYHLIAEGKARNTESHFVLRNLPSYLSMIYLKYLSTQFILTILYLGSYKIIIN